MPVVQKSYNRRKRKYGTEVVAFTARLSKPVYEAVEDYANTSRQSMGLALEELVNKALQEKKHK